MDGALTYCSDDPLVLGQIVEVPVGSRRVPGVVVKKVAQPDFKCKKIMRVLYSTPLPKHLVATAQWMAKYYLAPLSACMGLMLPVGVEKQRRARKTEQVFGASRVGGSCPNLFSQHRDLKFQARHTLGIRENRPSGEPLGAVRNIRVEISNQFYDAEENKFGHPPIDTGTESLIPLNPHQKKALEAIQKAPGATKLLHGVTGSGKTNIYLKLALNALQGQKSVILLVPEIALTGQLVAVFREVFGDLVTLIHSKQTEAERHLIFNALLEGAGPRIVVGPRSALFAPLSNLGLVIIDEEHESTYYQDNSPKYSAIRVASVIARSVGGECVLGSATPTVEDYYIAEKHKALIPLKEKAKASAVKPEIKIIDFKNRDSFSRNRYFSNDLLAAITRNLESGAQTLIFHNRRGSSPLTICEECGEELLCPNCFLPLTLHADSYELVCHTCDFRRSVPMGCPKCGHPGLVHKGFGTKLLESELGRLFPSARVRRFDADTKKGEGLSDIYTEVRDGGVDILVGTQTLAKGLDLPRLATVGVVQADAGLALPDFSSEERVFQLITQVIGRVGRGHIDTAEVFIQTYRPDSPVISHAVAADYEGFYKYILARRHKGGFPPFKYVMRLEASLKTERLAVAKVRAAAAQLGSDSRLLVSPPMPAFHERTARGYTWEIIVRSSTRRALIEACVGLDRNFRVTMDPPSLL